MVSKRADPKGARAYEDHGLQTMLWDDCGVSDVVQGGWVLYSVSELSAQSRRNRLDVSRKRQLRHMRFFVL